MTARRTPFLLLALAGLLSVYLVAPLLAGGAQLGLANWRSIDAGELAWATLVSLASASLSTAVVTACGVPLGYVLGRRRGRATSVLGFVVQLPLALPPLSSGVLLLFLLGYASPLGWLTGGALTDSFLGIVLAQIFVSAPFLIIAARSAFSEIDANLEDVAATLGRGPWAIFGEVTLPLVWRAVAAGMLLSWLRAFGEFGATVMVAYHPYSLPVYTFVSFGADGLPAMIPVLAPTLLAAFIVMFASGALVKPAAARAKAQRVAPDFSLRRIRRFPIANPAPTVSGGPTLEFAFARRLDGFALDASWRASSRRLAILGASGSGKSMTLRCVAGLDPTERASTVVEGRDVSRLPPQARGVSYVPQNYGLFPHMSVSRQIKFPTDVDGDRARRWMERLGLEGLENRRPSELSLGQQQRVALARALSRRADLVLLDEPFSALDAPLRARMRREMLDLQQEFSAITVLVTHDPTEALLLSDELLLLENGRVLQSGLVEEVFRRPASEAAARLLGAENVNEGYAVGPNKVSVGPGVTIEVGGAALPVGARVGWAARADCVRINVNGRYPARVVRRAQVRYGAQNLTIRLGEAELVAAADPSAAWPDGVFIDIDPQAIQVWPASDGAIEDVAPLHSAVTV